MLTPVETHYPHLECSSGGSVERDSIPPGPGGHENCRDVMRPGGGGLGGGVLQLFSGYQAHWWVLPRSQPQWSQHVSLSCEVPMETLIYFAGSSQRLVDGVTGSQGQLSAYTDSPQSLSLSSVYPQEPCSRGHCLSMEGSPFWLLQ